MEPLDVSLIPVVSQIVRGYLGDYLSINSDGDIKSHMNGEPIPGNAIELLVTDYNLRNLIGKNSRKTIYEKYSTDIIGNQYLKILNSL